MPHADSSDFLPGTADQFDPPGPAGKRDRRRVKLEWLALLIPLLAAAHFLALRRHAAGFPGGDEGSWMSMAAQLSRGEGFTTRWLEFDWQTPYRLPRPDDYRFPGLTLLLAAAFKLFGLSYATGLAAVNAIFLIFIAAVYAALRKTLGFWPAFGAACVTAFSPLQLQLNSVVYTEGLFGMALAVWMRSALAPEEERRTTGWWLRSGAGVGLLYLVRANGLLLFAGVLWQFGLDRRRGKLPWNRLAAAAAACLLVASPWMIRNFWIFGNPLHVAGSAGVLRDTVTDTRPTGLAAYFGGHSIFFLLIRVFLGSQRLLENLHFFDHGLEILPLAGLALGLGIPAIRRSCKIPGAVLAGFAVSFAACAFAAWDSWAGLRYFSMFLPFAYGLGIFYWLRLLTRPPTRRIPAPLRAAAVIIVMLLPTFYPHRFYERHFRPIKNGAAAIARHIQMLETHTPDDGLYYGGTLCEVNFLTDRRCVGLQELRYNKNWFQHSEAVFHPRLMALKWNEDKTADIREALDRYRAAGFTWDTVGVSDSTFLLRLLPPLHS